MSSDPQDKPTSLPTLFSSALKYASEAYSLASIDDATQSLLFSSVSTFRELSGRLDALGLFSENETLEDVSTGDIIYILVPFAYSETLSRLRTKKHTERVAVIREADKQLRLFIKRVGDYGVVPPDEASLFLKRGPFAITDPSKRREVKIKQYQKEKEIRGKVDTIRARRDPKRGSEPLDNDFDLIASLLPSSPSRPLSTQGAIVDDDDDDDEDEDGLREVSLLLVRLFWGQAHVQLENLQQEIDILKSAPPEEEDEDEEREAGRRDAEERDSTWRLDMPQSTGGPDGRGPLLDAKGKPLRPFTIVSATDRARLQAQVFQPDHRLPTMTIDDYLAEEQRRGNILTGGGAASGEGPTSSEQLAIDAEADGTVAGYEKGEEKRAKDENWAQYTEEHAKGSGNTMNRG